MLHKVSKKVGRLISLTDTRQEGEFYAFKFVLTDLTQEGGSRAIQASSWKQGG